MPRSHHRIGWAEPPTRHPQGIEYDPAALTHARRTPLARRIGWRIEDAIADLAHRLAARGPAIERTIAGLAVLIVTLVTVIAVARVALRFG